ncbi:MAG: hypothetical protein KDB07_10175 [Planctomycetes bacterium]|nr:hypothetical protein [Planctomycetota bacterium]
MRKSLGMTMLATAVGLGLATSAFAADTETKFGSSGLELKSGDYSMKLSSVFQTRLNIVDNHNGGSPSANEGDSVNWNIRRFKTTFAGTIFDKDKWSYSATLAWNSDNTGRMIETAYVGYQLADGIKLGMGREKLKFNLEEYTSSSRLTFVDRSDANEMFNNDFATGVWMSGAQAVGDGKVHYNLGIYNGTSNGNAGQNRDFGTGNMRNAFMINARLGFTPFSDGKNISAYQSDLRKDGERDLDLYVGLGLNYQMLNNGEIAILTDAGENNKGTVAAAVLDTRIHWEGLSVNVSYFNRSISVDRNDDTIAGVRGGTNASALQLTAGYNMNLEGDDQLEFAFKYGMVNDDDNGGVIGTDREESGLAVNYRFNKDKLKATFDANYLETEAHGAYAVTPTWNFRFQVQIKW